LVLAPEAACGIRKRVCGIREAEVKERAEEGYRSIYARHADVPAESFLATSAHFSVASRRRPRARTPTLLPYLACAQHDSEHDVVKTTTTTTVTPRAETQIAIEILTTTDIA